MGVGDRVQTYKQGGTAMRKLTEAERKELRDAIHAYVCCRKDEYAVLRATFALWLHEEPISAANDPRN